MACIRSQLQNIGQGGDRRRNGVAPASRQGRRRRGGRHCDGVRSSRPTSCPAVQSPSASLLSAFRTAYPSAVCGLRAGALRGVDRLALALVGSRSAGFARHPTKARPLRGLFARPSPSRDHDAAPPDAAARLDHRCDFVASPSIAGQRLRLAHRTGLHLARHARARVPRLAPQGRISHGVVTLRGDCPKSPPCFGVLPTRCPRRRKDGWAPCTTLPPSAILAL